MPDAYRMITRLLLLLLKPMSVEGLQEMKTIGSKHSTNCKTGFDCIIQLH